MENKKRYEVLILSQEGTCDSSLFGKMARKGDLQATKLIDLIGAIVKITGYALCRIETDEKTFDTNYYDTEEYGLISTGSSIFADSVIDYFGEVEYFRLTEVKTKKGKTYKAVPVLNKKTKEVEKKEEITEEKKKSDELPF